MTDRSTWGSAPKRISLFLALACAPTAAFLWLGCSSDDNKTGSAASTVNPGGTWGALVDITVEGRGRVTTSTNDVDCPSLQCFGTYIFPSNTADGATGGVILTATPTPGAKFLGWTFTPDPLGSRGAGPDPCNPVVRPATVPQVTASALQITLPYGQIAGTPNDGGTVCAGYTNVPLAYHVTAQFDSNLTSEPDGAPLDGGNDGGAIAFVAAAGASNAKDLGIVESELFWHYTNNLDEQVIVKVEDPTSTFTTTTQTIGTVTTSISQWTYASTGLVFVDGTGAVNAVRVSDTTIQKMGGTVLGSCTAVTMDEESDVYCRTSSGNLVMWQSPYTTPQVLYTGLASGNGIVAEESDGPFAYGTTTAIEAIPFQFTDGGVADPSIVVSTSLPSLLTESTSRYAWASGTEVFVSSSKTGLASSTNTNIPNVGSITSLFADPLDDDFFFVVGSFGVVHADAFGAQSTTALSMTLNSATADTSSVYYALPGDANIYRASRQSLGVEGH